MLKVEKVLFSKPSFKKEGFFYEVLILFQLRFCFYNDFLIGGGIFWIRKVFALIEKIKEVEKDMPFADVSLSFEKDHSSMTLISPVPKKSETRSPRFS